MFTGITTHAGSLATAIVVLTGAAILRGGAAAADPNQDDQFLALLNQEGIPALSGMPSLIDTAHKVCGALDGGVPAGTVVKALVNFAFSNDPTQDLGRYERTETRFVHAAVGAYCPYDQGKIASVTANPAPGSNEPTHRVAGYMRNAVNSGSDLREPPAARDMINLPAAWQEPTGTGAVRLSDLMDGGVFLAGRCGDDWLDCHAHGTVLASLIGAIPVEVTPPNPPQIPTPPPAQTLTPPRPIAAPPRPKQPPPPPPQLPPPPPKRPPPPPQQVEPPAVGPQPGGAPGSGGSGGTGGGGNGGNGGGGSAEPSPTPPMPPGFVRLAP